MMKFEEIDVVKVQYKIKWIFWNMYAQYLPLVHENDINENKTRIIVLYFH